MPPVSTTRIKSLLPATHSPFFRSIYCIYLQHFPTNRPSLNILVDKNRVFLNPTNQRTRTTTCTKRRVLCELIFATLCAAPHDMQIRRGSGGQWLPYDALSCECASCCSYCQMTEDIVPVTYVYTHRSTTMRSAAQYILMVGSTKYLHM